MFLGVASWLGSKFGIQTVIIRILFIIFTVAGGAGILLYFILFLLKILSNE